MRPARGVIAWLALAGAAPLAAQLPPDAPAWTTRIGASLPLTLPVRDETGTTETLGSFFGERPVLLMFGYRACPGLCAVARADLINTLNRLNGPAGDAYEFIHVSIDPHEGPADSAALHAAALLRYTRARGGAHLHFLTADAASLASLQTAAGFVVRPHETSGALDHSAGLLVLSPAGRITKLFPGFAPPVAHLEAALADAAPVSAFDARGWPRVLRLTLTNRLGPAARLALETLLVLAVLATAGGVSWLRGTRRLSPRLSSVNPGGHRRFTPDISRI